MWSLSGHLFGEDKSLLGGLFVEGSETGALQMGTCIETLVAWYNARISGLPLNRWEKEQVVFSEEGPRVPKISLALEQPQGCTGASVGLL